MKKIQCQAASEVYPLSIKALFVSQTLTAKAQSKIMLML
jgi:hypothetical protein